MAQPLYTANAKIGKCHRYNEKDIFPINTKNLEDKILVITSSLLEKLLILFLLKVLKWLLTDAMYFY